MLVIDLGGLHPGGNSFRWEFDGEVLSYLKIQTGHNDSADCIVYGFRFANSY
jgi:hypothetical protein